MKQKEKLYREIHMSIIPEEDIEQSIKVKRRDSASSHGSPGYLIEEDEDEDQ